jgi:hypothetical protein
MTKLLLLAFAAVLVISGMSATAAVFQKATAVVELAQ